MEQDLPNLPNVELKSPSLSGVFKALLAVGAARVFAYQTGVDHLTTLGTWSNPICSIVGLLSGATTALFLGLNWFVPPAGMPVPARTARLKEDNYFSWRALGAVLTIGFSVAMAWMCASLLGIGAQYLKGSQDSFEATVISERPTYSPRALCRRELSLRQDSTGAVLSMCAVAEHRPSLSTGTLEPGMPVSVQVRRTRLGVVVESVEPKR
jgi:hypothetical protein